VSGPPRAGAQAKPIDELVRIDGLTLPILDGPFTFDEDDFILYGMLLDPVYMPELLWKSPSNYEYHGQFRVRDYQYILNRLDDEYAIVACSRSVGKALGASEPVLTPSGWVPISTLRPGDLVIGSNGKPTEVLGVYPQGPREMYSVEFTDDTHIRCDADHLWQVTCDTWNNPSGRGRKGPRTRTTAQILASKMRYKVPIVAPVEHPKSDLPIPPWLLGVFLGEGSFGGSTLGFSQSEQDIVQRVESELVETGLGELVYVDHYDYRVRRLGGTGTKHNGGAKLRQIFASLGMVGVHCADLYIPPEYLTAALEDRLALFQGLADADGTVTQAGGVEISITSASLAQGIRQLALSLGGRARIRRATAGYRKDGIYHRCRDRYRVTCSFRNDVMPFWAARKATIYKERYAQRKRDTHWRGIRAIERAGRDMATCIKVAAEDGLFVARDYILTHNTVAEIIHAEIHVFKSYEKLLITAPELIHLLPLTDQVEDNIMDNPLLSELLDVRQSGQTGFTHRPFQASFIDGTKITGRIPKRDGPQPIETPVATPQGWTTMGDLQPGDEVIGSDGRPARVLAVTTTWEAPVYRVCFSDGSQTLTDIHHRWRVRTDNTGDRIMQTGDLMKAIDGPPKGTGGSLNMFRVPPTPIVQYAPRSEPLPIDPYVLGVLLGDGGISQKSARITSIDEPIFDEVRSRLPNGHGLTILGEKDRLIVGPARGRPNLILRGLRQLELLGTTSHTKFIPEIYMRATVAERLDLLRGLLDTDGTVKNGGATLVAASERLVKDASELTRSLGGWASSGYDYRQGPQTIVDSDGRVYDFEGGTYWRATLRVRGMNPFLLPRKAALYRVDGRQRHRSINAVVPAGVRTVKCIKVDAADETYLTEELLPTLNTGMKGQHTEKLIVEEGQDYPARGWVEATEAQPLSAPVLTSQGFVPMGSLGPGDLVIGSDGKPTVVLDIARQEAREVYRVHFSDGAWAECDKEHLWTVRCNRDVERGIWRTLATGEIEASLARGRGFGSVKQPWFVARPPIVQMEERDLPLDPYLLGLLLGDGSLRHGSVQFATNDEELVVAVRALIDKEEELVQDRRYQYRIRRRHHGSRWRLPRTRHALIEMGMWGHLAPNKFVPDVYLRGSMTQRLALLQGLIDTDGYVGEDGAAVFGSTSLRLADAVVQLVWSLGGALRRRVTPDRRGFRDMHMVRFRLPASLCPARLTRKAHCSAINTDTMRRYVIAVERLARWEPMQCLQLASADGLYITKDMLLTHNTVNYDARDRNGNSAFRYWVYGVHSGDKSSGFDERARSHLYKKIKVTSLRRSDWGPERKANAVASFGGTSSPDYKRNILGEPGAGTTAYFVASRLLACVDQNVARGEKPGSDYNDNLYVKQIFRAEELDELGMQIGDLLDLPEIETGGWWAGVDVGLTESPTVISLFAEWHYQRKPRITLMRKYTLERFRERQIREALYAITWHLGSRLLGVGVDVTGLGRPLFQAMEDDELCPPRLKQISAGYVFNAKVEVGVDPDMVVEQQGVLRDHLGNMVKIVEDELTGEQKFVVMMPFIQASTKFIAEEVDSGRLLLPFDVDVTTDMLQESKQRVERIGQRGETGGASAKKGDRFHILDSFRTAFYRRRQDEIIAQLVPKAQDDVLDLVLDGGPAPLDYTPQQLRELLGLG
jgi:intein/homing endonuclease